MAQAQIDRKRSLVEQALETSLIELKKARKENPTKSKENKKKEKSMAMKKVVQMAKLRTKELQNLEALKKKKKKNRPPLSTLKIEETNKIAAMEREAKKPKMDMPSSITPNTCEEKEKLSDVPPNASDDEKIAGKIKEEEWVEIPCPDGKEGCEVLHMIKRFPPVTAAAPPVNSPVTVPPPVNSPIKPNDWMNPIDPDEIQNTNAIHDMIFARGMASTKQGYWCLIVDAIVLAVIRYYLDTCEGCKTNSFKKHDVCELPLKTIWSQNRKAILSRVDMTLLMGKWTAVAYGSCGLRPSEIETLFHLCDPTTMLTRWYEDFHGNANTKVDYDDYDVERIPWRKELNTRMVKLTKPASWCTFDDGLAPHMQKTF